jgi:pyruvate carboxylase
MRVLTERGPEGLARWTLDQKRLLVTDTTFRDAHQSLLATRVRTADLAAIAPATAHLAPGLWSHEIWGGATFDVCLRFLKEDPWERLVEMRSLLPNVPFQMLLRGVNIVGYTSYPDGVVRSFIEEAASAGIDIFRIFDALNYLPNMTLAIEEVARVGRVAEAAICYTSDVLTSSKYDLDYYLDLATELERRGAHVLAIKDMAGLLKPYAAKTLVSALKDRLSIPIHLHTHDTSGNGVATCLMAAEAGVDVVDGALSSMSGLTSQPSLDAIVAALDGTARETGLDSAGLMALSNYWEGVRELYHPFESGLRAGTTEVYVHEIPGGQYSNLRPRAVQLGLGDRWELIKRRYREVDLALGGLIKVTPTSKVVADFAMFLVQNDLSVDDLLASEEKFDLPRSVIDFFQGGLGEPYGGFPEPLRRVVLRGTPPVEAPGASGVPESVEDLEFPDDIESALYRSIGIRDRLSYVLYPQVFREYVETRRRLGDLSRLPTRIFLHGIEPHQENLIEIEEGKTLIISLLAVGDVKDTGEREVYFELNGMFREVLAVDRSVSVETARRVQADPDRPEEVGAPMRGIVSSIEVAVGEEVAEGQPLVVTEAMKVETAISAPVAGRVETIDVKVGETVEAGDRIVRLDPEE